ncbi:hypothetical protein [Enterobacter mori]|uniref:hypothetical protein n=1 Tax=Enterobacter mori TaxID=539813 RepID=UPI001BFC058A|nr:hypothetical protein [Enterobacter mori]QWC67306.1 hypothetical protein JY395_01435 [Enterobacter mori]
MENISLEARLTPAWASAASARLAQEAGLVSHFTGEVKRYFYALHKNMLVAFDY